MLAALVVLLRTLGLLCSGHRGVALENVALRQQLRVLRRNVRRPHLRTSALAIDCFGSYSPRRGKTGERPCVGIANGPGAVGPNAQLEHVRAARARPQPFGHSSTR
jgi:hypothetical protein